MKANITMPKTDGMEISPGIFLIGEPSPRPDISPVSLVCLANVHGRMALVELKLNFKKEETRKEK